MSRASNVPGYEAPRYLVTDGDSNKLVNTMMTYLQTFGDAAFEPLKPSYESELDKLKTLAEEQVPTREEQRGRRKGEERRGCRSGQEESDKPLQDTYGTTVRVVTTTTRYQVQLGKVRY